MPNPFLSLHLSPSGAALACLVPGEGMMCEYLAAPDRPEPSSPEPLPETSTDASAMARSAADARRETETTLLHALLPHAASNVTGVIHLDRRGHRQGVDAAIAALGLQERFVLKNPESGDELSAHSAALALGKAARQGLASPMNTNSLRLMLHLADPGDKLSTITVIHPDDTVAQHFALHVTGQTGAARWLALLYTALSILDVTGQLGGRVIEALGNDALLQAFYAQVQTPEESALLKAIRALLKPNDTPMLLRGPDPDEEQTVTGQLRSVQSVTLSQMSVPEPRPSAPRGERLPGPQPQREQPEVLPAGGNPEPGADPALLPPAALDAPSQAPQLPASLPEDRVVGWSYRRVPYLVDDRLTVVVGPQAQLQGAVLMSAHNVLSLRVHDLPEAARRHPDVKIEGDVALIRARAIRRVHTGNDAQLQEVLDLLDRHPLLAQELTSALESAPGAPETRTLLRHALLLTTWGDSDDLAGALKRAMSEIYLSAVTLQLGHAYRSPDGHLLAVLRAPAGDVMLTRLDDPTAVLEDGSMPYPEMAYDGVELRFQLPEATPGPWLHLGRLGDLLP